MLVKLGLGQNPDGTLLLRLLLPTPPWPPSFLNPDTLLCLVGLAARPGDLLLRTRRSHLAVFPVPQSAGVYYIGGVAVLVAVWQNIAVAAV